MAGAQVLDRQQRRVIAITRQELGHEVESEVRQDSGLEANVLGRPVAGRCLDDRRPFIGQMDANDSTVGVAAADLL